MYNADIASGATSYELLGSMLMLSVLFFFPHSADSFAVSLSPRLHGFSLSCNRAPRLSIGRSSDLRMQTTASEFSFFDKATEETFRVIHCK